MSIHRITYPSIVILQRMYETPSYEPLKGFKGKVNGDWSFFT